MSTIFSTTASSTASNTPIDLWDVCDPAENKKELNDPILKIIFGEYINSTNELLWLTNITHFKEADKISEAARRIGFKMYLFDPIDGDYTIQPKVNRYKECVVIDCLEHYEEYMVRANVIKFALTCLKPTSPNNISRLTVIMKKGFGLNKSELVNLIYFATAKEVCAPSRFKNIEDKICLSAYI